MSGETAKDEDIFPATNDTGVPNAGQDDTNRAIVTPAEGIDEKSINKLSTGFLKLYAEDLKLISEPLDELRRNQEILLDTVSQENDRFVEAKESLKLDEMFDKVVHYHTKLVNIKKEMVALHEKTAKLKKRAIKLQQVKQRQTGNNVEL